MSTIGIAGVTIPGAVDCILKINRFSSLYYPINEHPNVILYQPNFGIFQTALNNRDWPKVLLELSKSVEALARMGADFALVPANGVHPVIAQLQKESTIPVLNILEIVCSACKERKLKKIGVMGVLWTMSDHLYKATMKANGIEEVVPSDQEQKIIHNAIFSEIIPTGTACSATIASLLSVVDSLKRRGCDGIALACTELPLVLNETNCGIPAIDTTGVLAKAALKRCAQLHL